MLRLVPACGLPSWVLHSDQQQLLLRLPRRHLRARLPHIHVDLAAYAESAVQERAGLHREPDTGNQRSLVRSLEVVDMRSGAVQIAIDRMPRAMDEVLSEAGGANHTPRRVVDCRSSHRLLFLPAVPQ